MPTPDPAAFEALVEPHLARLALVLRRRARAVLGADWDEDDLLQTVLVTAWRVFPTFVDHGPAATWSWLVALGDGAIGDRGKYVRAKGRGEVGHLESRQGEDDADVPASVGTSITKLVARREERERVHAAIDALPPAQRDAVVRHMLEGETLGEIARALGITKNAVWERLHRGMARLHEALQGGAA
jgi:RNA polymerase sigma-70 factor (ECF subfamily)